MSSQTKASRVGVEVGGTFTDLVAFTESGIKVRKVPSVPSAPNEGVLNALDAAQIELATCEDLAHGSTVATNAILERKGAKVAFVTTRGFRDLLFLQRHDRSNIYDIRYQKPVPVVARENCFEVGERVLPDGSAAIELDEAAIESDLIPKLRAGAFDAVAICLLNAYANPDHETRVAELLAKALPDMRITISADISREFREYERSSTTALSAYVQPVIDRYVGKLEQGLAERKFTGGLSIMQSNGGRLPASGIRRNAIAALFSGPAAGVVGALNQVGKSGFRNIITLDVGGTSSDICVVDDGRPLLTRDFKIDGLPVRTPMIRIVTTGAGGGSIVRRDEGGMLRVGPESAGADPGPACYGKGGTRPTISDAHMVRGTIRSDVTLGGVLPLQIEKAKAVYGPIAAKFGIASEQMADNAIRVADSNIVRAVEMTSTELGKDPRDYALVAFGGGGPLHAARVADALDMRTVVIPSNAGIISAYGLLVSDFSLHDNATRRIALNEDAPAEIRRAFNEARERLSSEFTTMHMTGPFVEAMTLEMRFRGQAYDIEVVVQDADALTVDILKTKFFEAYQQAYHYTPGVNAPIEIMGIGLVMSVPPEVELDLSVGAGTQAKPARARIFEDRRWQDVDVYAQRDFPLERDLDGPLLVEDMTSTLFVPEAWVARKDIHGNIILKRAAS